MTKVQEEGFERQVGPELSHYFGVAAVATAGLLESLYRGLGPEVLDDEDRDAMFPAPPPQVEAPNNVISFPAQPILGEIATDSAGVAPQEPTEVTPIQDFPEIRPPFQAAA
jgi:hypothetical protein